MTFVEINPAYTSQDCSNMVNGKVCGTRVKEMRNLKRREFECPKCGFVAPRDVPAQICWRAFGSGSPPSAGGMKRTTCIAQIQSLTLVRAANVPLGESAEFIMALVRVRRFRWIRWMVAGSPPPNSVSR